MKGNEDQSWLMRTLNSDRITNHGRGGGDLLDVDEP